MLTFGDCLRELMERRNLSCNALAQRVGTSQGYLSKILRGGRPPPQEERLQAWLDHLQATSEERQRILLAAALDHAPPRLLKLLRAVMNAPPHQPGRVQESETPYLSKELLDVCCQWAQVHQISLEGPSPALDRRKIS